MEDALTPREQGDIGEMSAVQWLVGQRAHVFLPFGHSPDVDLVAEIRGQIVRVEVKTTTSTPATGRWRLSISTKGGNQSWGGLVKKFDPQRCDYLFVLVGVGG